VKIITQLKESKKIIKNDLKHEDYKNTLLKSEQMFHQMKTIRSDRHQLGSYELNKVSLSCFDDKRDLKKMAYARMHLVIIKFNAFSFQGNLLLFH